MLTIYSLKMVVFTYCMQEIPILADGFLLPLWDRILARQQQERFDSLWMKCRWHVFYSFILTYWIIFMYWLRNIINEIYTSNHKRIELLNFAISRIINHYIRKNQQQHLNRNICCVKISREVENIKYDIFAWLITTWVFALSSKKEATLIHPYNLLFILSRKTTFLEYLVLKNYFVCYRHTN